MKKLLLAGTALGLVMSASAFAGGPDAMPQTMAPAPVMSDWYAGVEGGVAIPSGDLSDNIIDLDTGYDVGGHFGYDFGNDFKAELQYQFISNSVDKNALSQGDSANLDSNVITINGLYGFHMQGFDPYVGVGLGVNVLDASDSFTGTNSDQSETDFAYQIIAGVEYKYASNIGVYLDYHFVGTTDILGFSDDLYNNLINLGLNYYF